MERLSLSHNRALVQSRWNQHLLPEIVEDHDVCIHVEDVVAVGRVVICGPLFWLGALVGEHVIAMFGLIIDTVKACHLHKKKINNGICYLLE